MNGRNILTVYGKELRDTMRDRRTLLSMIVVPTLVMPAIILGFGAITYKVVNRVRQEVPAVMLIGAERSPQLAEALRSDKQFKLVPPAEDYRRQISDKKLRAALEIPPNFDAALEHSEPCTVKIYTYSGELRSSFAESQLDSFLRAFRERIVQRKLAEKNLPTAFAHPFDIAQENVAPPEKVGGNAVGGMVPYLLIVLSFVGAMYPAMDLTAGEKERGTMETILCSPVARIELVLGKFLTVLTASLATVLFSVLSFGASALAGGALLASGGIHFSTTHAAGLKTAAGGALADWPTVDPWGVLAVFGLVIPLAILFSALLFTVALFAKSYKEAQTYATPLVLVVILPAVAALLPGVELTWRLALVPVLNVALVSKEMVSGNFPLGQIGLIFGSSCAYAAAALALAVRMFERETVIFRT